MEMRESEANPNPSPDPGTCHLPRFTHHVLRCSAIATNSVPRYAFSVTRSPFPPRFRIPKDGVWVPTVETNMAKWW